MLQKSVCTPPRQHNRNREYCTGPTRRPRYRAVNRLVGGWRSVYRSLFIPIDTHDDRGRLCSADRATSGNTEASTETANAEAPVDDCAAVAAAVVCAYKLDVEQIRREILSGGRGRRARSEQGPHPRDVQQQQHLWAGGGRAWTGRSPWAVKRTSAPAMTTQASGSMRVALVLRTRRSWPVAPLKTRRLVIAEHVTLLPVVIILYTI